MALRLTNTPGGYIAENEELCIFLSGLHYSDSGINAILRAEAKVPLPRKLGIYRINLLSPKSRDDVAKALSRRYPLDSASWNEIIDRISEECAIHFMSPLEPQRLQIRENSSPHFLVENLVLSEAPNLFYGFGGTGKSLLSLFIALCVENGIPFFGRTTQAKTLVLDYETDQDETDRRVTLLARGLERDDLSLPHYVRAHAPLRDMLDALIDICTRGGFRLLIIDSAVCAVGDDLNASQPVAQFFAAVRKLNACGITVLVISHVAKKEKESQERTPYGSVYFLNFARTAWEIRGEWDDENRSFLLGMFCRKSNIGPLKPIGVELIFTGESIAVSPTDPEGVGTGKETAIKMVFELLQERAMKPRDIANELGLPPGTVWNALHRLKVRGKVEQKTGGLWKAVALTPF